MVAPRSSLATITSPRARIRVLIVDDSVVLRSLLTKMLSANPGIEVIGSARNGADALAKVERFSPDVVTMDIEMPEMDGIAALRCMQQRFPKVKVIMCSSLTERGARVTIEALVEGASDYVTKQQGGSDNFAFETLGRDLCGKILSLLPSRPSAQSSSQDGSSPAPYQKAAGSVSVKILAIGVSTGGPSALAAIVQDLPVDFPLPIVIVQHMPPIFTRLLAERLTGLGTIPVYEAEDGMLLEPGKALIAPGDFHLSLVQRNRGVEVALNQDERENSCRPAVDVLFRSVAEIYGPAGMGIILTGMGQDGLKGARAMSERGAPIIAQDAVSSVIWGMPGSVVEAGLATAVIPLQHIVSEVLRRI